MRPTASWSPSQAGVVVVVVLGLLTIAGGSAGAGPEWMEEGGTLAARGGNEEAKDSFTYLLLVVLMMACFVSAYILRQLQTKWKVLHETGAAILFGAIMGAFIRFFAKLERLQSIVRFDSEFFMLILLPPIIFESGYNMRRVGGNPPPSPFLLHHPITPRSVEDNQQNSAAKTESAPMAHIGGSPFVMCVGLGDRATFSTTLAALVYSHLWALSSLQAYLVVCCIWQYPPAPLWSSRCLNAFCLALSFRQQILSPCLVLALGFAFAIWS